MTSHVLHADLLQQLDSGHCPVNVGHRRRPRLKPARTGREIDILRIEGEGIALRKPSCNCRDQGTNQLFAHIHESQTGRPEKIFERAGNVEIQVHCFDVNGASSAVLIVIEHHQSTGLVSKFDDGFYFGTESISETDMRKRHDAGMAINRLFVMGSGNRVALSRNELDLGAACSLRQPDMAHRWKLKFAHHDFLPFAEIQGTGDAVDACRCAGYNSNFIGTGIDKFGKGCACGFVAIHP